MKILADKPLKISRGKYMDSILSGIPTNRIIFKTLPGIGATALEIETDRNSLIIEPNVPVIIGKCNSKRYKDKKIFGVYKNSPGNINDYLRSDVKYKKIIVTPESFGIVMDAMKEEGINPYKDYFMLFDECERTIQDINYRAKIILPLDDFFRFENKAFISATAIPPSDPRFEEQGFKALVIEPDFDYRQAIKVIITNNVITSLKQYLADNPSENHFIFLNSTDTIAAIQTILGIKNESITFCSKDSVKKLRVNNFPNSSTTLQPFKKYNFFTSRFFSAVDIEFEGEPSIIILTDLVSAPQTMIDPFSETVQIIGRFRKPVTTITDVCHIANVNPEIKFKTHEQIEQYFETHENCYNMITSFLNGCTEAGAVSALEEILEMLPHSRYLNNDGTPNYFMKDNKRFEERVKSFYVSKENLSKAYHDTNYFIPEIIPEVYSFDDQERIKAENSPALKSVYKIIMNRLKELHQSDVNFVGREWEISILRDQFPNIVVDYDRLGYEKCVVLNFNPGAIRNAIKNKNIDDQKSHFKFIKWIKQEFITGKDYSSADIIEKLKRGVTRFNLILLKPNLQLLSDYFDLSHRKTVGYNKDGSDIKGYTILSAKF